MIEIAMSVAEDDSGYDVILEKRFDDGVYEISTICYGLNFETAFVIASAFDLYDALNAVFPHIVIPTDGPDMDEAGEVGRKAIKALAKARGENEQLL